MTETGSEDDRGASAGLGRFGNHLGHCLGRRRNSDQIGGGRNILDAREHSLTVDLSVSGIDRENRTGKAPVAKIAEHCEPD
jgi:hypothetical protein